MRTSTNHVFTVGLFSGMLLVGVLLAKETVGLETGAKAPGAPLALSELNVKLPAPSLKGTLSVEEAIKHRRTIRSFADRPLTLAQLSQLLWAAQGITDDAHGFKRAVPSAGATYPIEIYVACGEQSVKGLAAGVWRFSASEHSISKVKPEDQRAELARDSVSQMWAAAAPVTFAIVCEYSRTAGKYGERAAKYVHYEAGNVSQNVFLQCEALGLSAGIIGAFNDDEVSAALGLPKAFEPLLLMPVGYKKSE
ncbi:MAG: SagB/ThcOx family dehydrogenase [Candidatus Coatesbacteria bacterium]|nr:SagB/ThcOx family dehydrogenase [Candidatus Coatesbacteria bacterium]